jgi:protein-S-isoprenylcysteine O-methyltransferase Ste14
MQQLSGVIFEIVFDSVMLCWIAFAAIFLLRKKPPGPTETTRNNAAVVGLALEAVGFSIVWMGRRQQGTPIMPVGILIQIMLGLITVAAAIGSVWFVVAAVRTLGKHWAVAARLVEGHKLVTSGPYSIVRNPIYSGMFGMMIATGLATSRWEALLIAIIVFWAGTIVRVRAEEKLLRKAFGTEFEEYIQKVPSLFPRLKRP